MELDRLKQITEEITYLCNSRIKCKGCIAYIRKGDCLFGHTAKSLQGIFLDKIWQERGKENEVSK